MTPHRRRLALWAGLGLVLAAGLVYAFRPRPVPVDLVPVEVGPLQVTLDEEGRTRVRDAYMLSAPVAGRARRIELEVGDPVVAGETVVAEIDPIDPTLLDFRSEKEARAAVGAAEATRSRAAAALEQAEAELDFARAELRRYEQLRARGAASEQKLDIARREFRSARAALETTRAALQEATFELDRARARLLSPLGSQERPESGPSIPLRAPVSGRVLRVPHESARVVPAGEPLLEIGDPQQLEVVVDLLSADAVRAEPGQRVLLEQWGGEVPLEGRVRRVEPYGFTKVSALGIEEQRVNVIIDLLSPPEAWRRLGDGYRVEARIVLWEDERVRKLPLSALFRQGEHWAVFAVENGVARTRRVERGPHNGLEVEILSGLESGEQVVRYPSPRVAEGVRVEPR